MVRHTLFSIVVNNILIFLGRTRRESILQPHNSEAGVGVMEVISNFGDIFDRCATSLKMVIKILLAMQKGQRTADNGQQFAKNGQKVKSLD